MTIKLSIPMTTTVIPICYSW